MIWKGHSKVRRAHSSVTMAISRGDPIKRVIKHLQPGTKHQEHPVRGHWAETREDCWFVGFARPQVASRLMVNPDHVVCVTLRWVSALYPARSSCLPVASARWSGYGDDRRGIQLEGR